MTLATNDLVARCASELESAWEEVMAQQQALDAPADPLAGFPDLIARIRDCLNSRIKTYHYVLPTQLLAKVADPDLDARSLQAAFDSPGAFDARTVAHEVIVPFDQANYRVLGGSPEPYVNNPVRVHAVTADFRGQQKNQADWDKLVEVLAQVETAADKTFTQRVFAQTLVEIYRLLADVQVVYPTPNRISLSGLQALLKAFLDNVSGGQRMEAVAAALFQTIGAEFGMFDEVRRSKVNAADRSTGMLADIECRLNSRIVLLVEVKERALSLTQLDTKVDVARSQQIAEILFLAQSGSEQSQKELRARISAEFASGQNIYVENMTDFSLGIFILMGERGRHRFVVAVGVELDRANASIEHRRTWAELLKGV